MTDFLIGTGGWAYFKVDNNPSLKTYSHLFNFVEVNYTFYEYPPDHIVEGWRRSVPTTFTFSVRCNQDLTHRIGLVPSNPAFEVFYQMRSYCDKLGSPYLVLETPAAYQVNKSNLRDVRDFFSSLNLSGIQVVWEYRAAAKPMATDLMRDFGIIQCVDLSKRNPDYNLEVTYSRLFGKGHHNIYQFTDDELAEIDQKAQDTHSKTVILSYHGARMNTDAIRFKHYKETGKFLPVTSYIGVDSAKAVLAEDAHFPASKAELKVKQGWKVFDLTPTRRVHVAEVLDRLPDKTYSNLDDFIEELRTTLF